MTLVEWLLTRKETGCRCFCLHLVFLGDLQMFSTPHSPLSEKVFVEKNFPFFVSSCPLKCIRKSTKPLGSWDVGLCTNGHLVSQIAFNI